MNKKKLQQSSIIMGSYKKLIPYYCRFFPKQAVKMLYRQTFQKPLNLDNPRDFNEKINWLKVYDYRKNKLVAQCADKYQVRDYVRSCGCEEILNDLYGVYKSVDEIEWEELPHSFVLKFSSDCGLNFICEDKNKYDQVQVLKKIRGWFGTRPGDSTCELHYRLTKPVIICERYIRSEQKQPVDHKIMCINGKPGINMVCTDRETKTKYLFADENYQRVYIDTPKYPDPVLPPKPKNYSKMYEYAEKLAEPFPFVRVDLYEEDDRIIFGELTFTPFGGFMSCMDQNGLDELGRQLKVA